MNKLQSKIDHNSSIEDSTMLFELNCAKSRLCNLPNLSGLRKLRNSNLHDCGRLQSLQNIEILPSLVILNVNFCTNLAKLPTGLHKLPLTTLVVSNMKITKVEETDQCIHLQIFGCHPRDYVTYWISANFTILGRLI